MVLKLLYKNILTNSNSDIVILEVDENAVLEANLGSNNEEIELNVLSIMVC